MDRRFSIVIPTRDRLESLREVVAAVEAQRDAPDFELIVVDDGSVDGTLDWLRDHAFSIPSIVLRQDQLGPAAARNAGVAAAGGERIAFLGDDTVPSPTWLASHARAHDERGRDALLAVVGHTRWHRRMRVTPFLDYLNERGLQFGYGLIRNGDEVSFAFFYTSNLSLSRRLLVAEPFDVRLPFAAWEDIECGYRLCRGGLSLVYDSRPVAEHSHATDLTRFCARQERAGEAATAVYRLHPELASFLGLGPQGPPALPSALWHRVCLLLARAIEPLPVGWPRLWDAVLHYHYVVGVRRGWSALTARADADAPEAPAEAPSDMRRVLQ